MKKGLALVLFGTLLLTSCTTDSFDTIEQQNISDQDVSALINKLVQKYQAQNAGLHKKETGTLQNVINQIETTAMQDADFLQLVTTNYTTPQAVDIEAVLADSDLVLANLNVTTTAKSYITTILSINVLLDLNNIAQTIANHSQLTTAEKNMLLEVIDLHQTYLEGNGSGDDDIWYKKGIIAYAQGATQTKANAVLNAVIIKTIENQN